MCGGPGASCIPAIRPLVSEPVGVTCASRAHALRGGLSKLSRMAWWSWEFSFSCGRPEGFGVGVFLFPQVS